MSFENFTLPNGEEVEFDAESHVYTVRGVTVPSITQLLERAYGDHLKFVDPEVVERAAVYGTKVHKEIQDLIELQQLGIDIEPFLEKSTQETCNYFKIVAPVYKIKPLYTEIVVVLYDKEQQPIAAGRFDLAAENLETHRKALCDFKTTTSLNLKLVSDQLNLYKIACEQSGYFQKGEITELAAIHLSGLTCRLRPIRIFQEAFYEKYIQIAKQNN